MSRLGAEHVVGHAKGMSTTEMDRLFRTERLFFAENAAIFAKRLEGAVARDVQVDIEAAARIHGNDAEEIDSLDAGGVVVIERKKVREFSTEDLPTGIVIIEAVVPTWMPVQNPPAQWFAPGRRIRRRRGLMDDLGNGHGQSLRTKAGPSRPLTTTGFAMG